MSVDKFIHGFSISWLQETPAEDGPPRQVVYGQQFWYPSQPEAAQNREWHVRNVKAWVPAIGFSADVSELAKRLIRTDSKPEAA